MAQTKQEQHDLSYKREQTWQGSAAGYRAVTETEAEAESWTPSTSVNCDTIEIAAGEFGQNEVEEEETEKRAGKMQSIHWYS